MEVFIKASNISPKLGENFSLHGSLTPNQKTNLTKLDLIGGYKLTVQQGETKVVITPIDAKVTPKELNINNQNQLVFSAKNFSNIDYRPISEETSEILEFRRGIFPSYKIEEIEESIIGDRLLLNFLDQSIAFTIIGSEASQEEEANIKYGSWDLPNQDNITRGPSFIFKKYNNTSLSPVLEIHNPLNNSFYKIYKNEASQNFEVEEFSDTDEFFSAY